MISETNRREEADFTKETLLMQTCILSNFGVFVFHKCIDFTR